MGEVISADEVKASRHWRRRSQGGQERKRIPLPRQMTRPGNGGEPNRARGSQHRRGAWPSEDRHRTPRPSRWENRLEPTPKPKPAKAWPSPRARWLLPRRPKSRATSCPSRNCSTNRMAPQPRPSLENNCLPTPGCSRKLFYNSISKSPKRTSRKNRPSPATNCIQRLESGSSNRCGQQHISRHQGQRINILAPVPGRSSVSIEVPNRIKTKVLFRDIVESPEWKKSKAKIRSRWARTFTANRLSPTSPRCTHVDRRCHRFRQIGLHQLHRCIAFVPVFTEELRFT